MIDFDASFDGSNRLRRHIEAALLKRGHEAASIFVPPTNSRGYVCRHCDRPAYARGLCNAHYMRMRAGKSPDAPVRARKRGDACVSCGVLTGTKGGWGLCSLHYKKERYAVIKDALINAMGGACARCNGQFHRAVFDLHHRDEKLKTISDWISAGSTLEIALEAAKCELLCANCHRLEHYT